MGNKFMETSFVDKALHFTIDAHHNTERRGKKFPYVIHPMEVVAIVSTMTPDPELLAAAALHDVVEDTHITIDEIRNQFGDRVADIVLCESDKKYEGDERLTWHKRKQDAIDRLAQATIEQKMVALGDKLSNMRAIYQEFRDCGEEVWNKFHVKVKSEHEWHYRGLAASLKELSHTTAYHEFVALIDKTFGPTPIFSLTKDGNRIFISGNLNGENTLEIEKELKDTSTVFYLDFAGVNAVNYAALRTFIRMYQNGIKFIIENASYDVMNKFSETGVSSLITVLTRPRNIDTSKCVQSGDGFTAITYNVEDGDSILKLYRDFFPPENVRKEKAFAKATMLLGIPTPMAGELVKEGKQTGVIFERVKNKKSYSRLCADDPENIEQYAKEFAFASKKFHETDSNTTVFPSAFDKYSELLKQSKLLDDNEKAIFLKFMEKDKDMTKCIHGDFHMGNAIKTDKGEVLFIDLGDEAYGNPLIDIGGLYFVSHSGFDELAQNLFHMNLVKMEKFWSYFIKYYAGIETEEQKAAYEKTARNYAAYTILMYEHNVRYEPWMREVIVNWLLKDLADEK